MNNGNLAEDLALNVGADVSRCLCIPCAVSENDFKERIAEDAGEWDGPDAPRAWINGRGYNLLYSPPPVKASCVRCGEEIHCAYHPDTSGHRNVAACNAL